MDVKKLVSTARELVAPGKGILAADESTSTITKRLASIHVESTVDARQRYRDLLFTAPSVEDHISGVILYDETIRQSSADGTPFPELLASKGVIPGIKVDKGAKTMALFPGETITEGLDGLRDRLVEYRNLGARFAKWRAVIHIGEGIPTANALSANAEALARYAALCQENDIVPIIEPEVLMDGGHSLEICDRVTTETLNTVFAALYDSRIILEGMLLKPNMTISGIDCPVQADVAEVAQATIQTLKRTVPSAVPGIVFLSGGQSAELATAHLDAMNRIGGTPWELSFSYGRALQSPVLEAWKGDDANRALAQAEYIKRAKLNGLARYGQYKSSME